MPAQVTNEDYLEFVKRHPEWRRSKVSPLFTDDAYLSHWKGDLDPGPGAGARQPVTFVSWFAASAYCRARGEAASRRIRVGVCGEPAAG